MIHIQQEITQFLLLPASQSNNAVLQHPVVCSGLQVVSIVIRCRKVVIKSVFLAHKQAVTSLCAGSSELASLAGRFVLFSQDSYRTADEQWCFYSVKTIHQTPSDQVKPFGTNFSNTCYKYRIKQQIFWVHRRAIYKRYADISTTVVFIHKENPC